MKPPTFNERLYFTKIGGLDMSLSGLNWRCKYEHCVQITRNNFYLKYNSTVSHRDASLDCVCSPSSASLQPWLQAQTRFHSLQRRIKLMTYWPQWIDKHDIIWLCCHCWGEFTDAHVPLMQKVNWRFYQPSNMGTLLSNRHISKTLYHQWELNFSSTWSRLVSYLYHFFPSETGDQNMK